MNVLLIVDRAHLMNECQQLHRLAVALTANGCSVKTLIPEPPAEDAHSADHRTGCLADDRDDLQEAGATDRASDRRPQ